jgi:hypothetical protein
MTRCGRPAGLRTIGRRRLVEITAARPPGMGARLIGRILMTLD